MDGNAILTSLIETALSEKHQELVDRVEEQRKYIVALETRLESKERPFGDEIIKLNKIISKMIDYVRLNFRHDLTPIVTGRLAGATPEHCECTSCGGGVRVMKTCRAEC